MSVTQELDFHLGENWIVDFTVADNAGVAIDITGATLQFRVSSIAGSTVMTRAVSDGITVTSGSAGECRLNVTPAHQTSASITSATRYLWEFRAQTASLTTVQAVGHINVKTSLFA